MGFANTAPYRRTELNQAEELGRFKGQEAYTSLVTLNENTKFGICLALCIEWINYKVQSKVDRIHKGMANVDARMGHITGRFGQISSEQSRIAKVWSSYSGPAKGKFEAILSSRELDVARPIMEIAPLESTLDTSTVIVQTLEQHVPYIMAYYWSDGSGHAIVCYRTTQHWSIFDPNCGEMRATASQLQAMWDAYWLDVKTEFKTAPIHYGLASVGVVPQNAGPRKKKCLLATAACASLGLPEEHDDLERLRSFRDDVVARRPEGRLAIGRYYDLAPGIVTALQRADAQEILHWVQATTIVPAAKAVAAGETAAAVRLFDALLARMESVQAQGVAALMR